MLSFLFSFTSENAFKIKVMFKKYLERFRIGENPKYQIFCSLGVSKIGLI